MSADWNSSRSLRELSTEELVRLGDDSLRDTLLEQAVRAHQKHAPLDLAKLDALLADTECVRYPTRIVYEVGEMAAHQFAQPDVDYRIPGGRVLYLHPNLRGRSEWVVWAVAYMLPALNYGEIIRDEHCLAYGATMLGLLENEFYHSICTLADAIGAETRYRGARLPDSVAESCCS